MDSYDASKIVKSGRRFSIAALLARIALSVWSFVFAASFFGGKL